MGLPFDMADELDRSAALQLIREAALSSKAAEGMCREAGYEIGLLKQEVRRMGRLVDQHEAMLDGNGTEGLKERLSHAKRTADGNRAWLERLEAAKGSRAWDLVKIVVAAVVGAVVAILLGGWSNG